MIVPDDVALRVRADARARRDRAARGARRREAAWRRVSTRRGARVLVLDAHVGLGSPSSRHEPYDEPDGAAQVRAERRRAGARRGVRGDRAGPRDRRHARSPCLRRAGASRAARASSSISRSGPTRRPRRRWLAVLLALVAGSLILFALGFSGSAVVGNRAGRRRARARVPARRQLSPRRPRVLRRSRAGGASARRSLLPGGTPTVLAPGAVAGALAPDRRPLALAARPRSRRRASGAGQERGTLGDGGQGARLRPADARADPAACAASRSEVAALARRQERELRGWLYDDRPLGDDDASLVAALSAAAADIEELHGVRVELASAGDCPRGRRP